jgi:hypothetical protein
MDLWEGTLVLGVLAILGYANRNLIVQKINTFFD